MNLFPYESTVDEVLSQYDLTDKQKVVVKARIDSSCPWFSKHAYSRAHHEAAKEILR